MVVKSLHDLAGIQCLDESTRFVQTVDMVTSDDGVESMPLRAGTVEELECEVSGSIQKSNMGDTLEELVRVASELVQPSSPSGVSRFNAQIFGANSCATKDAELTYSLHEIPNGRALLRKLIRQQVDVLRQRIYEEAWSEDRGAEQQSLIVLPLAFALETIEELNQGARTGVSRTDPCSLAKCAKEIGIAERVIGSGQPIGTGEPARAEHSVKRV